MPGAPGGSSPNAVGEFYVPATAPSWSPITFQQPVDSAAAIAVVVQKQVAKPVATTSTILVATQKQASKSLTATSAGVASVVKQLTKKLTLSVSVTAVVASLAAQLTKLLSMGTATTTVGAALVTLLQKFSPKTAGRRRRITLQAILPRFGFTGALLVRNPTEVRASRFVFPTLRLLDARLGPAPLEAYYVPQLSLGGALLKREMTVSGYFTAHGLPTLDELLTLGLLEVFLD